MATIYFASNDAKRKRYYREGQSIAIDTIAHVSVIELSPGFWRFELDSTGTCYIDVSEGVS